MASNVARHLKDVEEEAFIQVNTLLLDHLNTQVKSCPPGDMTDLLEHKAKTYPALRKLFRDSSVQSATESWTAPMTRVWSMKELNSNFQPIRRSYDH
ncbi:uncharacterized protein N7525_004997 [Penicillium rubens]|jgi:hypothetical protein|uniref:uncharacterized protein n=1 Tax=Penicillium rubens TaxID=1108849 RepID=UPI002A59B4D1|nr:uncharacterized protein N7525_004997 [Penicillium rubens]KAJ5839809.1 hypothetical protein N7525_004997 [Penicillium rubens]